MQNKITSLLQTIKAYPKRKKIVLAISTILFISVLILVPLVVLSIAQSNRQVNEKIKITAPYVPDEIIIKYKKGVSVDSVFEEKIKPLGGLSQEKLYKTEDENLSRYYIVKLEKGTNLEDFKNKSDKLEELEVSEPNYLVEPMETPNDPMFDQLWGLQKIDVANAWNISKGSQDVIVGVIDSGIDGSHEDLSANLSGFVNCIGGNCQSTSAFDDCGHGTHVSGTIGGIGNNGIGVVGVNWNVKILGVKTMGPDSQGRCGGNTSDILLGITYAVDNGAKVINMSLGSGTPCTQSYQDAIDYGVSRGVIFAISAGNSSADASGFCPSSCNGVITVGSTTSTDARSSFSNYGSVVEVSGPGSSILSSVPGGGYEQKSGTSMSAPHVAGVAALLLSVNPNLSPSQVSSCIVDYADSISTDYPVGPRLNAFKTLNACSGLAPITGSPQPTLTPTPALVQPTPTPPSASEYPYIRGMVRVDENENGKVDGNEAQGVTGVEIALSGPFSTTYTTDGSGNFYFSKIKYGEYSLTAKFSGQTVATTDKFTLKQGVLDGMTILIPIRKSLVLTPTPTLSPTPEQPGNPPAKATPTPTIKPYQKANCVFDPTTCKSGAGSIQQCTLKCTPI